jgi:hypothetical protein
VKHEYNSLGIRYNSLLSLALSKLGGCKATTVGQPESYKYTKSLFLYDRDLSNYRFYKPAAKESLAFLSTSLSSNKKNRLTPLQGPTER